MPQNLGPGPTESPVEPRAARGARNPPAALIGGRGAPTEGRESPTAGRESRGHPAHQALHRVVHDLLPLAAHFTLFPLFFFMEQIIKIMTKSNDVFLVTRILSV